MKSVLVYSSFDIAATVVGVALLLDLLHLDDLIGLKIVLLELFFFANTTVLINRRALRISLALILLFDKDLVALRNLDLRVFQRDADSHLRCSCLEELSLL